MVGVMMAAWLALSLVAHATPDAAPWVDVAHHGDTVRPRYPDLSAASAIRDRDISLLRAATERMSAEERELAAEALRARLEAVREAESSLRDQPSRGLESSLRLADTRSLLVLEASTLELQLGMVADDPTAPLPGGPARPRAVDRVAVGDSILVGASERVRDAIAVGGDIVVRGHVTHDAVSVLGDIVIEPGGRIDGDTIVVGGSVRSLLGNPDPAPHSGWLRDLTAQLISILSLGGAGVLTLAMAPQRVHRVAGLLGDRPVAALIVGVLGTLGLLLAAVLLAITIVGIPVALLILAGLVLSGLFGVVAMCQTVGDHLPLRRPYGRWTALAGATALLTMLGSLPFLIAVLIVLGCAGGVGAALMSRLGSEAAAAG